jgi:two-component system, chemotaxis family, protein-glutamate methylesterase/glutaminase
MFEHDLIVVGTSAGGLEALQVIVRGLPKDLPAAILIVMHMSPQGPYFLPEILRKASELEVVKAIDGAPIEHGKVYIAPPDQHLLVKGNRIGLSRGPKENRARPAIDPLFRTAAAAHGTRVVGVILTGMLDDGTAGLATVKERGGLSLVQDPLDALYPSMPESALKYVGADFVLPVSQMAALLARLARESAQAPEDTPASRLLEIECRFVEMETMSMKEMDIIGSHAGVSCPECHGPIWKIKDGTLQRYRCHVGHAYSAQTMVAGQVEAQEVHLWQALRLMKERVSLIWELRSRAEHEQRARDAEAYDTKITQLQKNIALIQTMVEEGDSAVGPIPEAVHED